MCRSFGRLAIERVEPQAGRPQCQVLAIKVGDSGEQVAHVGELDFGTGVPGPVELGNDEVLWRYDEDRAVIDRDATSALELLTPVVAVLAHDEIHLHHQCGMDDVERRALDERPAHCFMLDIEVVSKKFAEPTHVGLGRLNHDVDVSGHAWHRVVVRRDRSGHHIRDTRGLEPSGDDLEDLQLLGHTQPPASHPSVSEMVTEWTHLSPAGRARAPPTSSRSRGRGGPRAALARTGSPWP